MTTVAIIQARMNSTRLPGKVLRQLNGQTMLARVVQRVRRAKLIDQIVIATTIEAADDPTLAERMRVFRNHGIITDHRQRAEQGSWFYEMVDLGYNYRLTDFQCALGLSQLRKLPKWVTSRREIAKHYDESFVHMSAVDPLKVRSDVIHAYHLYVVRLGTHETGQSRDQLFSALRARGIGVNVHYIPVHLHPFYQQHYRTSPGLCPIAEEAYEHIITLPVFPAMSDEDVNAVVLALEDVL
jgi:perosamine synthetase